jgi:hypothetical protein
MTIMPQCFSCIHFHPAVTGKPYSCAAFPDRIPREILMGEHDHLKPFPGDQGIRYEPKPGAAHYPSA